MLRTPACRVLFVLPLFLLPLFLGSCGERQVAPGIEPEPRTGFFERRMQVRLPAQKADAAVVFIGGFTEQVLVHSRACYEEMPPLPLPGRQLRAFYAWDGGRGCLLAHSTKLIQDDLRAFMRINPQAVIVLIGHSYGGSAAMDVLRGVGDAPHGRVIVLTLDPVSHRERSLPRERAAGVDHWINVYCSPYRHAKDVFAAVGGPWRHCPQADVNLMFSGGKRDAKGRRFQHSHPDSLLKECPEGRPLSAYGHLVQICETLSKTSHP